MQGPISQSGGPTYITLLQAQHRAQEHVHLQAVPVDPVPEKGSSLFPGYI